MVIIKAEANPTVEQLIITTSTTKVLQKVLHCPPCLLDQVRNATGNQGMCT